MLEVAHTPRIQTLILRLRGDESVVRLPSLPALTTLCVIHGDVISEAITILLALNTGIRRLMLSECDGISDLLRLLKADSPGSAANTLGTVLLPSLGLLQVCGPPIPDADGFHALCARRPSLRIEYGHRFLSGYITADELKEIIEELRQNDEPGVFRLHGFERRVAVREDDNAGRQTASADA